eukprot:15268112-Heterocapsa_arctica.AAC.1
MAPPQCGNESHRIKPTMHCLSRQSWVHPMYSIRPEYRRSLTCMEMASQMSSSSSSSSCAHCL